MSFKIYNHAEKTFVYDPTTGTSNNWFFDMELLRFNTRDEAEKWKEERFELGEYPDKPHTILEIIEE